MPGVMSRVFVSPNQAVKAGDVLLSVEAIKIQTALHAEKEGTMRKLPSRFDQITCRSPILVCLRRALVIAFKQHLHGLHDEAVVVAGKGK